MFFIFVRFFFFYYVVYVISFCLILVVVVVEQGEIREIRWDGFPICKLLQVTSLPEPLAVEKMEMHVK